jgi:TolB-like protein/class 3 adenylate cyclase/Tfp pilus assembly protein PilF
MERRLAAILAADVVGYSRLMEADEADTLAALKSHRQDLVDIEIAEHHGRIVKLMGDGALVEFASVVDAVACAVAIQEGMAARNEGIPEERRIVFRIGVHVGDVMVEDNDLYGDGVNVAARLEGLAEPGGISISQQALDQVETKLDLAYEDLGERQVKNIARPVRAYQVRRDGEAAKEDLAAQLRLSASQLLGSAVVLALIVVGAVAAWWQPWKLDEEPVSASGMVSPPPDQPSIAVLPFNNMSGDAEQEYFTDGMTEDLITDLAKVSGLLVIARNSTFAYKGQSPDVREVARELDVRYVVEGSVRKASGRIRINALLIDAETGTHLWAERYDRQEQDVFDLQDEVRAQIVAALRVELTPAEETRLARPLTISPEAYDAYLRGLRQESFFTKEGNLESRRLFGRALELDPAFAAAAAKLATAHSLAAENGWSPTPEDSMRTARLMAEKAVALDDNLPLAHWALARVLSRRQTFDGDRAIAELEKAVRLDPNYADAYAFLADTLISVGRAEEALGQIERAMRLNPHFPFWYYYVLGTSQFMLTRYDAAVGNFQSAIKRNPTVPWPHRMLAASYGHLGMTDEAEWELEEVQALGYELSIVDFQRNATFQDPTYLERYADGLRKAGLSENPPRELPDKPSIAILPFDNLSGDPDEDHISDGISEDLTTDLSRISSLFVFSRNAAGELKPRLEPGRRASVDPVEVAKKLGADYVLEGSVRRSGTKLRINAQLIDGKSGVHAWAARYDRDSKDVFVVLDEVVLEIVTALKVRLTQGERAALEDAEIVDPEAWDILLRGIVELRRFTRESNMEAEALFRKAVDLDPDYARAWANVAFTLSVRNVFGWTDKPDATLGEAERNANKALALDDSDVQAHLALHNISMRRKQPERAVKFGERIVALDPSNSDGYVALAVALDYAGRHAEGLAVMQQALFLTPRSPFFYVWIEGKCLFMLGRYEEALARFEKAVEKNPEFIGGLRFLAATQAHLGRIDDAEWTVEEILLLEPDDTLARERVWLSYVQAEDIERYIEGLRLAGIPE